MSKIYVTLIWGQIIISKRISEKRNENPLEKEPDNEYDKEAIKVT